MLTGHQNSEVKDKILQVSVKENNYYNKYVHIKNKNLEADTLEVVRHWDVPQKILEEKIFPHKILNHAILLIQCEGKINVFSNIKRL